TRSLLQALAHISPMRIIPKASPLPIWGMGVVRAVPIAIVCGGICLGFWQDEFSINFFRLWDREILMR
ncbi:MAG: hypothetical protein OEZ36_07705, partial [Spirochaetota bacterium]|nr:hypothetical protein [Spirochaetota bacterium]